MHKLIDVKNAEQEKAFELHGDPDALYLNVKCSDNKHHSRIVVIKVSDALYPQSGGRRFANRHHLQVNTRAELRSVYNEVIMPELILSRVV